MPTTSRTPPTRPSAFSKPKKKYPRRRCDNCGDLFEKKRKDQHFCTKDKGACRKQFHKFGAAYGPLKQKLLSVIDQQVKARSRAFVAECVGELEARVKELEAAINPLLVGREQAGMKTDADGGQ